MHNLAFPHRKESISWHAPEGIVELVNSHALRMRFAVELNRRHRKGDIIVVELPDGFPMSAPGYADEFLYGLPGPIGADNSVDSIWLGLLRSHGCQQGRNGYGDEGSAVMTCPF